MSRQDILQAAIEKNKEYLANKDALIYHQRIAAYSAELLTLDLAEDDAAEPDDVPVALSSDKTVAIAQLLAATGHPITLNEAGETIAIDPAAVAEDASAEQNRELGLLGFWGVGPDRFAGGDHSLRDQYYSNDGTQPNDPDLDAWADYIGKK